jgi:hypothetical protein
MTDKKKGGKEKEVLSKNGLIGTGTLRRELST